MHAATLARKCIAPFSFSFSASMAPKSQQARIDDVAPELRALVEAHNNDTYVEGCEALNATMHKIIEGAGLMEEEIKLVGKAGCHPDNREEAMIVMVDAHDLLRKFHENGYNPSLWDAFAARIPKGKEGERWRAENVRLAKESDGRLAACEGDTLEIVTGRGSHSTSALRMVLDGRVRSIHPELADAQGFVSKAKLLEAQPSWREPLEKGVLYKIIPGELELAIPGLLACLSRLGNASHDVYRVQTALQLCSRIHSIINSQSKRKQLNMEQVVKQASVGNGGNAAIPQIKQLATFVVAWSGGQEGHILKDLEAYERACTIKRKLSPADLGALADLDMLHGARYIKVT